MPNSPSVCSVVEESVGDATRSKPRFGDIVEYSELRVEFDAEDFLCGLALPWLLILSNVLLRVWPCAGASVTGGVATVLAVLGRRSKGPGEIVFNRLEMFSPALVRGLSGANSGLGAAYP